MFPEKEEEKQNRSWFVRDGDKLLPKVITKKSHIHSAVLLRNFFIFLLLFWLPHVSHIVIHNIFFFFCCYHTRFEYILFATVVTCVHSTTSFKLNQIYVEFKSHIRILYTILYNEI